VSKPANEIGLPRRYQPPSTAGRLPRSCRTGTACRPARGSERSGGRKPPRTARRLVVMLNSGDAQGRSGRGGCGGRRAPRGMGGSSAGYGRGALCRGVSPHPRHPPEHADAAPGCFGEGARGSRNQRRERGAWSEWPHRPGTASWRRFRRERGGGCAVSAVPVIQAVPAVPDIQAVLRARSATGHGSRRDSRRERQTVGLRGREPARCRCHGSDRSPVDSPTGKGDVGDEPSTTADRLIGRGDRGGPGRDRPGCLRRPESSADCEKRFGLDAYGDPLEERDACRDQIEESFDCPFAFFRRSEEGSDHHWQGPQQRQTPHAPYDHHDGGSSEILARPCYRNANRGHVHPSGRHVHVDTGDDHRGLLGHSDHQGRVSLQPDPSIGSEKVPHPFWSHDDPDRGTDLPRRDPRPRAGRLAVRLPDAVHDDFAAGRDLGPSAPPSPSAGPTLTGPALTGPVSPPGRPRRPLQLRLRRRRRRMRRRALRPSRRRSAPRALRGRLRARF